MKREAAAAAVVIMHLIFLKLTTGRIIVLMGFFVISAAAFSPQIKRIAQIVFVSKFFSFKVSRKFSFKMSSKRSSPKTVAKLSNGTTLSLRFGDICKSKTDVVVNAANASSFTRIDGGVSGALRNACRPEIASAISAPKFRFATNNVKVPAPEPLKVEEVRFQDTFGTLRDVQGVRWIIHALGPNWQDEDSSDHDQMVSRVSPRIHATIITALDCASRLGASSISLPAISGGIFTHKPFDDKSRELHELEQRVARQQLVRAIFAWAKREELKDETSSLKSIIIVTLPAKGRRKRQARAERKMLEDAIAEQLKCDDKDEDVDEEEETKDKTEREPLNIRIAMISDTHGAHQELKVPKADLLIHAGDFTRYGRSSDAESFNSWMGKQPHEFKLVVNGNHEHNAPWQKQVREVLSNCVFLKNESVTIRVPPNKNRKKATSLKIHGTDFFWPMRSKNPHYDKIPDEIDILICHGPCKSFVDGGLGCTELRNVVARIKPRLVVSGHIHKAHGTVTEDGVTYVNAANVREGHGHIGWPAVVLDI